MTTQATPFKARLTTNECEELIEFSKLQHWQTDYKQSGRGQFHSSFNCYQSAGLHVTDQFCNREMLVSGIPPAKQIPLYLLRNEGDRGIFNGKPLETNEVFVMRSHSEGSLKSPADLRLIGLQVPEDRLRNALHTMADHDLDQLIPNSHRMILPEETIEQLTTIAQRVVEAPVAEMATQAASIRWQQEAEDFLVTTLVSGLTQHTEHRSELGRTNRLKYVARAREYIETNLDKPLGLETLAQALGISLRTLNMAFKLTYDVTPLQYIKTRRLHAARRQLLKANTHELLVTDVGLASGFTHLSYFARDYQKLFGEQPSETLKRRPVA